MVILYYTKQNPGVHEQHLHCAAVEEDKTKKENLEILDRVAPWFLTDVE